MSRPWFAFYAADLLVDGKIALLTDAQFRMLILVWCRCCLDGGVPKDPKLFAKVMRCRLNVAVSTLQWLVVWLSEDPSKPGLLVSERMLKEEAKYNAKVEKLRVNGKSGGRPRKAIAFPEDKQKAPQPQPQPQRDNEGSKDPSCPEPPRGDSVPTSPTLYEVPCSGTGPKTWPLTQAKLDEWMTAFPGIDVKAELRKAIQYLKDNPTKLKTHRGCPAYFGRWLGRAQDRNPKPPTNGVQNGHSQSQRHAGRDASLIHQVTLLPEVREPDPTRKAAW